LPDLYHGDNVDRGLWMEDKDWWYERSFPTPATAAGRRATLVFHGLDTFATVWLNGQEVGRCENMFIRHEFDVTGRLAESGTNRVVVRLASPRYSIQIDPTHQPLNWSPERLFCRKAQMSFGWDIAPRILTVGIWRPVELLLAETARLDDVWIRLLRLEGTRAVVRVQCTVDWLAHHDGVARLHGSVHGRSWALDLPCRFGRNHLDTDVILDQAPLWWPVGHGEPALIDYSVTLSHAGRELDTRSGRTGLRRVELVQEPQSNGALSCRFRVNGRDVLITGLNWTPLDALFTRVTPARLTAMLEQVAGVGCSMLRVWGGGIYEPQHFYAECDRLGIMVWQDFMLACGWYPQDDDFARKLDVEARQVVRDLRNHPCVALWAGDNEIDGFWPELAQKNRLTRTVLATVCADLDPDRPYIPSSPFSPSCSDPWSWKEGDVHYYGHGKAYTDPCFMDIRCRFLSEFGHMSLPSLAVISTWFPPGSEWPLTSPIWRLHGSDTIRTGEFRGPERIAMALRANGLPEPRNLAEAVVASQTMQADAVETWITRYCADPEFGGFLLWNVSDCWPQLSDSVIDYLGQPKEVMQRLARLFPALTAAYHARRYGQKAAGGRASLSGSV